MTSLTALSLTTCRWLSGIFSLGQSRLTGVGFACSALQTASAPEPWRCFLISITLDYHLRVQMESYLDPLSIPVA